MHKSIAYIIVGLTVMTTIELSSARPAYAYLDPGTGSIILQGILGALAAGAVMARIYWHRLLSFLGIRKNASKNTSEYNKDAKAEEGSRSNPDQ